jgi:hypothetical protein
MRRTRKTSSNYVKKSIREQEKNTYHKSLVSNVYFHGIVKEAVVQ